MLIRSNPFSRYFRISHAVSNTKVNHRAFVDFFSRMNRWSFVQLIEDCISCKIRFVNKLAYLEDKMIPKLLLPVCGNIHQIGHFHFRRFGRIDGQINCSVFFYFRIHLGSCSMMVPDWNLPDTRSQQFYSADVLSLRKALSFPFSIHVKSGTVMLSPWWDEIAKPEINSENNPVTATASYQVDEKYPLLINCMSGKHNGRGQSMRTDMGFFSFHMSKFHQWIHKVLISSYCTLMAIQSSGVIPGAGLLRWKLLLLFRPEIFVQMHQCVRNLRYWERCSFSNAYALHPVLRSSGFFAYRSRRDILSLLLQRNFFFQRQDITFESASTLRILHSFVRLCHSGVSEHTAGDFQKVRWHLFLD